MTIKQLNGRQAPDGAEYGALTDGNGTTSILPVSITGSLKGLNGAQAPDGSTYITLTDGNGNLA